MAGGVVYVVVGIVGVALPVKDRVHHHTVAGSAVTRHAKRVVPDKVSCAVGVAGVGAV